MGPPPANMAETYAGRYRPLATIALVAALGILADRFADLPAAVWWSCGAASVAVWFRTRNRRAPWPLLALLAAVACTAATWHQLRWSQFDVDEISRFAEEHPAPVCLRAVALECPMRVPALPFDPLRALPSGESSRLTVVVEAIRNGTIWRPASGRAEVFVDGHLLGVSAGDQLLIVGQLSRPAPARNPGGFDAERYARAERTLARLGCNYPDAVTRLGTSSSYAPRRMLDHTRRYGDRLLGRYISPDRAGLASAMLFGLRGQLGQEHRQAFVRTGTFDLLAISGLHVGVLAGGLFLCLRFGWMSHGWNLLLVAMVVVCYALLTGAQPPVVRATCMVLFVCAGLAWSRRPLALNSLAAAALVVLALNPADMFRVGPQLSFVAVATLIAVGPAIARWPQLDPLARLIVTTRPWPQRAARHAMIWTVRSLALSTAIALAVMPLITTHFHLLSLVGIPLHPLLWIPMSVAMLSGFGMFLCGWLMPPLAAAFGAVCDLCLAIMETIVQHAETLPGGHSWVAGPSPGWTAGCYLLLGGVLIAGRGRVPRRWVVALLCGWVTLGLVVPTRAVDDRLLRCTFLDVGHGTAVVVELPRGHTIVYDVGQLGWPEGAARVVTDYLWSRGIRHVDAVVISHADVDHCNGLPSLLDRVSVGAVLLSPLTIESDGTAVQIVRTAIQDAGVPIQSVWVNDRLRVDPEVYLNILHPPREGVAGSANANSVVLAIEYAGRRILLPGDLETPGLERLLREDPLTCDVVMAPHHGSALSDPPRFAAWSGPQWVVVSGGRSYDVSTTGDAYQAEGASVLHTSQVGAIQIAIDAGGAITARSYRVEGF